MMKRWGCFSTRYSPNTIIPSPPEYVITSSCLSFMFDWVSDIFNKKIWFWFNINYQSVSATFVDKLNQCSSIVVALTLNLFWLKLLINSRFILTSELLIIISSFLDSWLIEGHLGERSEACCNRFSRVDVGIESRLLWWCNVSTALCFLMSFYPVLDFSSFRQQRYLYLSSVNQQHYFVYSQMQLKC